jgi:V/A-type H+-transporting ATPase subunit A
MFPEKEKARTWFNVLRQKFLDMNVSEWGSKEFKKAEKEIRKMLEENLAGKDRQEQSAGSRQA